MNTDLTKRWIDKIFPQNETQRSLLIWDSFTCHTDKLTKELLNSKNICSLVIPGGCTGQLQTLDVCINRPFKVRMEDLLALS